MRSNSRRSLAVIALAGLMALAGCIPEANRERGGDAGGDIRNVGHPVQMHGQEDGRVRMFYETPSMGKGIERSGSAAAVSPEP